MVSTDFTVANNKKGTSFDGNLPVFSTLTVKVVAGRASKRMAPRVCSVGASVSKGRCVCKMRLKLDCGVGS